MSEARVVEASLRRFQCAYEGYVERPFPLGALVVVREGQGPTYGVVAEVSSGPDDPTRPLRPPAGVRGMPAERILQERPHIRPLLRTRVTVVCCGHQEGESIRAALPPAPPPLLSLVAEASAAEAVRLASDATFLAPLIVAPECDDAVIAATIRRVSTAFETDAREFTIRAGKELARLLKGEPTRLTSIIRGVAP